MKKLFDACPLPWKAVPTIHKATKSCHHTYRVFNIVAANGNRVKMTEKLVMRLVEIANAGGLHNA